MDAFRFYPPIRDCIRKLVLSNAACEPNAEIQYLKQAIIGMAICQDKANATK